MKLKHFRRIAVLGLSLALAGAAGLAAEPEVTAVFSRVKNNYVRKLNADGSVAIETYIVAKGGYIPGAEKDDSIEHMRFPDIVRLLAAYLGKQNYYPARDGKKADLMLVIYWGRSIPGSDGTYRNTLNHAGEAMAAAMQPHPNPAQATNPAAAAATDRRSSQAGLDSEMDQALLEIQSANSVRQRTVDYNARLLGYMQEINDSDTPAAHAGADTYYQDLISDVEEERYYMIINAFDFQEALQHKKNKLLWSTRVSVRARGNRFDEQLAAMVASAARYFGRDSGHLVKDQERTPEIKLGELKNLGPVDDANLPKK